MQSFPNGGPAVQTNLGTKYALGEGVPLDLVLAYGWINIAAATGEKLAIEKRAIYEPLLSSAEKEEAQRISLNWKKGQLLVRESKSQPNKSSGSEAIALKNSGTGFLVDKSGLVITNSHVIADCKEIRAQGHDGVGKVKGSDIVNDIALIAFPLSVKSVAPILENSSKLRQGDDVVVFGFPLNSVLSSGGNLTPGVVSALTGLGNNTNQIQITAPIQPGSSGSPVLNRNGEVVGVVSSKISDIKLASATGQVGQNINFAVGGQTLKSFLISQGVKYSSNTFSFFDKSTPDLADEARVWTVLLECWK